MGEPSFEALAPPAGKGRIFAVDKRSGMQDTTVNGRIRLDVIARLVAEVAEEDLLDLDCVNTCWWLARKIVVEVIEEGVGQHTFTCRTWAGGMARVAAERRVALVSDGGAIYETSTTWVSIDSESGRPVNLPQWFVDEYSSACEGRKASIRSRYQPIVDGADEIVWHLRQIDFDQHKHVNNRAYWPVIEEILAIYDFDRSRKYRVEIDFRSGVPIASTVLLRVHQHQFGVAIWWVVGEEVAALATIDYLSS